MIQPLFTYPVRDTTWYIIVGKGANHFYFDAETGISVWQLSDTNIDDLASKVNFDELAVLFAKANGLRLGRNEHLGKKRKFSEENKLHKRKIIEDKNGDKDTEPVPSLSPDVQPQTLTQDSEFSLPVDRGEEIAGDLSVEVLEDTKPQETSEQTEQKPAGLDLGYSSSEDEDEDGEEELGSEQEGDSIKNVSFAESEADEGVNSGLDLAFESEDEGPGGDVDDTSKSDFKNLLDEFTSEISIYDPWFLVEEELLPKLAQNAAFYGVKDSQREQIFDEWVAARVDAEKEQEKKNAGIFPTDKLRFFQFSQEFKPEVRKLYYLEFYKKHAVEIDALSSSMVSLNPGSAYRELRVTLNDYAEHEKAEKKRKTEGNLKVAYVETYLRRMLDGFPRQAEKILAEATDANFWDSWINICNEYSLPEKVVDDANNFIVGDEKRFACYVKVLGLTMS